VFDQIKELTHQFVLQKKTKTLIGAMRDGPATVLCIAAIHLMRCPSGFGWFWLLAVVRKTRSLRALSKDDIVAVAGGFNTGTSSSRSTRRCLSQTCLLTFLNS
jgi:hypothetical protein